MCRYRQVRNFYTVCGHGMTVPDEVIQCYGNNCVFSPNHPEDCVGGACKKRCWQYRQHPQQYTQHKQGLCPDCAP